MLHIRLSLCILLLYCTIIKTMDQVLAPFACAGDSYQDHLPKLWEDGFVLDIQCPLGVTNQESDTVTPIDNEAEDDATESVEISRKIVTRSTNTKQKLESPDFYAKLAILRKEFGQYDQKGTVRYACQYPQCTVIASSMGALKNHDQKQHVEWARPYQCNYPSCGLRYRHLFNLYVHAQRHFSLFFCPFSCNILFGQSSGLAKHIQAHHGEREQFSCRYCKMFSAKRRADLVAHISRCLKNPNGSNTNAKPQLLSPESVSVLANMIIGKKRKLIPETPHFDTVHDEATDSASSDEENDRSILPALENRFRIYKDGMYQYRCQYPQCNVVKLTMTQISKHARTEHRDDPHRPYCCDYGNCTHQFKYFSVLRSHVIQHLELHHCESCDTSYPCSSVLEEHKRKMHPRKKYKS